MKDTAMQLPASATRQKKCKNKECGFVYEGDDIEHAFRPNDAKVAKCTSRFRGYRPTCRLCEQDRRTEKTKKDRWRVKMVRARYSHAKKLGISVEDMENKHGWVIETMMKRAMHNYANGCPECHMSFATMGNGLADLTVDIYDRRIEPDYDATRDMCLTCNRAKGVMTPEDWVIYKRLWRERADHLAQKAIMPELVQMGLL